MSRQQKILFPKINPGLSGYPYPSSSNAFNQRSDEKSSHRVFRTKRKHVQRACERCRVKKAKCDGNQPCSRCVTYNQACIFRDRRTTQEKVYSRGFVEMLISQHAVHIRALRDLYKRCVRREGFPGSPLQDSIQGYPGTHAILDRLGLIKHAEEAIEDPQKVLADIVEYLKCLDSAPDCCLDSVESRTDTSDITVSEDPSPEPNTPRESLDSAVPPTAGTWTIAASEEAHLCHVYGDYKPAHPQYTTDIPLPGGTGGACAIRTDELTEVPWNYYPYPGRYIPTGIDTTSYSRIESVEIPPSAPSSWPERANHPSASFMPITSRGGASEPLIYTTEQSDFAHGYAYAQGQEFVTGPIQRQHQRQPRHSVDYGLLHSGEQHVYL